MATGRAVITPDAPGCRETIVHGESGLLVPPRDVASLARAMTQLLAEPGLIQRFAAAARARAETKYDVRNVNAGIIAVLRPPEYAARP
jgi:glycosyltransferase involved in cell wall biosynthesis